MSLAVRIEAKAHHAPDGTLRPVLRDVAFTAGPGDVLALFGASGTGKSTALRIVMGLDADYRGTVRRGAGRLGALFQEPRLLPWLTVGDNLRLVRPGIDAAAALAAVGLPDAADLYPGGLSLGMARRAALARALAVDPALLVLDEPFASLDPRTAAGIGAILAARAAGSGTTILFSTHEIEYALSCAHRVLVLSGNPATLSTDQALPAGGDRNAARGALLAACPFLGTLAETPAPA